MSAPILVLKFGSSVLAAEEHLPDAVREIYSALRRGYRVVAVVSALGDSTDRLLARAHAIDPDPDPRLVAALLASGEHDSATLLALALGRAGLGATRFDERDAGLATRGPLLDADPVALDVAAFERALAENPVVVLPGFVGVDSASGATSLLGRGGSDLTALFVAERLGAARCVLVKDVDGLYARDPASPGPPPARYATIAWDDALALGSVVVQPKAIRFARERGLEFEVGAIGAEARTLVGDEVSIALPARPREERVRRVALLGLGTVGGGVLERLRAVDGYEVVRVLVRDAERHVARGVPAELCCTDPADALAGADLVVECLGGLAPAGALVAAALANGLDVVSSNKALIAARGPELAAVAERTGGRLRYAAAVGGAVPMLETVRRIARSERILGIEAVLNGTCNFVLDRMAEGIGYARALEEARACGFAEADPTLDVDGTDAAQKLELLAREAFRTGEPLRWIRREGIERLARGTTCAAGAGHAVRLVASCLATERGPVASVRPLGLPASHPLASVRGEGNALVVERAGGPPIVVRGKGAGRWPTVEALLADVFELGPAIARARPARVERADVA